MSNTQAAPVEALTDEDIIAIRKAIPQEADAGKKWGGTLAFARALLARAALAQAEAARPVLFMSPKQLQSIKNPLDPADDSGTYLPIRKTPAGNFTLPLYAAPQPAEAAPVAKAERVRGLVNAGPYPGMSEAFDAHMGAACWTDPAWRQDAATWAAAWKAALSAAEAAPKQEAHADDAAVGAFAAAMREKLALARAKGRSGWQTCSPESLSEMLRDHVEKGDPRDVANFCMFLWSLGAGITAPLPGSDAFDRWVNAGMGVKSVAAPKQEAVAPMTPGRAAYFMERFLHEEKLLGPNEQAALHYVIAMLEAAQPQQPATVPVALTVRVCSFPESNGKRNWTAMIVRRTPRDGLMGNCGGVTIAHSEFWNRAAYEAERARFLLGERDTEPYILDYGDDIQAPEQWAGEVHGGGPVRAPQTPATEKDSK